MIDRCDPEIALWSDDGESFVVKQIDKFSTNILPQYFKHSNFSSFARQLNFYGFRKLKAEPILTADYDARTASHVRFYHECFQKGKPELLVNIKRATKSDTQSKDEVEALRMDLHQVMENMNHLSVEFERKLTEITFDLNSKIAALHGKIAELQNQNMVQQSVIQQQQQPSIVQVSGTTTQSYPSQPSQQVQSQYVQQPQLQMQVQQSQLQQSQPVSVQLQQLPPQQQQHQQHQMQVPTSQQQPPIQQQTQFVQQQPQTNVSGNKMGGLLAAGLSIKSPALPSQQAQTQSANIPGLDV